MYYFLDTEFTDFKNSQLISLGMVSLDGKNEFYVEVEHDVSKRSAFVSDTIVPLLNQYFFNPDEASEKLNKWLDLINDGRMEVIYDYGLDAVHFSNLLYRQRKVIKRSEPKLKYLNNAIVFEVGNLSDSKLIASKINGFNKFREEYFAKGIQRHNALVDAKAMLYAWKKIF